MYSEAEEDWKNENVLSPVSRPAAIHKKLFYGKPVWRPVYFEFTSESKCKVLRDGREIDLAPGDYSGGLWEFERK